MPATWLSLDHEEIHRAKTGPLRAGMNICGFLLLASSIAASLRADTIYQTNAQGRQVVIQRNAIVVKDDPSFLVYKHFDLKERRVVKVTLNQGSLRYSVDTSNAQTRRQIVDFWRRFGYKATLKDAEGKTTSLSVVYFDFYPPGGRGSLLESVPARTDLPLLLDSGSADDIEFYKISVIQVQGERLKVMLREGRAESGRFLLPTDKPVEVRLLGITDNYQPDSDEVFDFSESLNRLVEIRFE